MFFLQVLLRLYFTLYKAEKYASIGLWLNFFFHNFHNNLISSFILICYCNKENLYRIGKIDNAVLYSVL